MAPLRDLAILCSIFFLGFAKGKDIKVQPGGSIQAAIEAAAPGDRITVAAGTYAEQLTISKDGIQLTGHNGAVLVPPSQPVTNGCTGLAGPGTNAGICIIGGNVVFADFVTEHRKVLSVGKYVEDVLVKGFTVNGFVGLNIAVVGAKDAVVRENTVNDGTDYGILTVGSKSTLITNNAVSTSDLRFIGICMDDQSDVTVSHNTVSAYGVGLCVQTNRAEVTQNTATNCCVGVYVDPGVNGAHITHNTIGATNPLCPTGQSSGIIIDGAPDTDVEHNTITDQTSGVAVFIFDDTTPAAGSTVEFNDMENNHFNVYNLAAGKVEIQHNHCSNPSDNCNF